MLIPDNSTVYSASYLMAEQAKHTGTFGHFDSQVAYFVVIVSLLWEAHLIAYKILFVFVT